ncbi:MAG: lysophospholipid acyltransferase family protein [Mucilaginibacter sp.]
MIIKSKPVSPFIFKLGTAIIGLVFKRKCNKLVIEPFEIKPDHSYILMCNHFSFWDGFWAACLCRKIFFKKGGMQRLYIMSVKKQMEKNKILRYMGSFSVEPGKRSITESFDYISEVLSQPGNLLLFYPQGNLESAFIRHIKFDEGLYEIVTRITGNCQLVWSSNLVEFYESFKPSIYSQMLDCGTNHDFDFDALKQKVNTFHLESIKKLVRYTNEPKEGMSL